MMLRVNGENHITNAASLAELIGELELGTESLVVEYNKQIIRQELWPKTTLNEQDQVELLSFVGGG